MLSRQVGVARVGAHEIVPTISKKRLGPDLHVMHGAARMDHLAVRLQGWRAWHVFKEQGVRCFDRTGMSQKGA